MTENSKKHLTNQERIKKFRLLDDIFFRSVIKDDKNTVEQILRIIMDKDDLKVESVIAQDDLKNLFGRSTVLDIHAVDSQNTNYNIEIERSDSRTYPKRLRYHSSIMDTNILKPGMDEKDLPESYVIFLTENDKFKEGQAIYPIENFVKIKNELIPFNDGRHYLIVNGSFEGNDPLGKLLHDFRSENPDDMNYPFLKEKVEHFKREPEGVENMSSVIEEIKAEGIEEGLEKGEIKKEREIAEKLFKQGIQIDIISNCCSRLNKNDLLDIQNEILKPTYLNFI